MCYEKGTILTTNLLRANYFTRQMETDSSKIRVCETVLNIWRLWGGVLIFNSRLTKNELFTQILELANYTKIIKPLVIQAFEQNVQSFGI